MGESAVITVTESELLDALRQAATTRDARPEGALTIGEIAAGMNRSRVVAWTMVCRLLDAGKVECVKVPHRYRDGRNGVVPAYRLVKPDKAA